MSAAPSRRSSACAPSSRRPASGALAIVATAAALLAFQSAKAQPVVEEEARLPVGIGDKAYTLDTLVVRRAGADKRPVALITHGANFGAAEPLTLQSVRGWTHDLAHRGWLAVGVMRRGYGRSDGPAENDAGNCTRPNVARYLEAHADDLEAALRAIARRPDAEMGRVLVIGHSSGGAATLALAARPTARLTAAINVSGGLGWRRVPSQPDTTCPAFEADLVRNFARFGGTARMPTLWLYGTNDSWFPPALAQRLQAAFTGGGGRAELVVLPPFGADGHAMFFASGGRGLLLPDVDRFLRTNGLPTWNPSLFSPLLGHLSPSDRESVERYLRMPTEKVLAIGPNGGAYWQQGERTLEDARTKALAYCRRQTGQACTLAAENFDLR